MKNIVQVGPVPESFKAAFLKWNGVHTEAEIAFEWEEFGGLCGTFFREGLSSGAVVGWNDAFCEVQAAIEEMKNNLEAFGEYSQETARCILDGILDSIDDIRAE